MEHGELGIEKIKVRIKLDKDDVLHMYKVHTTKLWGKFFNALKWIERVAVSLMILAILFVIVYLFISYIRTTASSNGSDESDNLLLYGLSVLLYPILMITCPIAFDKLIKRKVIKDFYSNQEAQNEIDYIISNDDITIQTISSYAHHNWSNFMKVIETNQLFALYPSNNTYMILPKRFFVNENEINRLRDMLKEKYPDKYRYVGTNKEKK